MSELTGTLSHLNEAYRLTRDPRSDVSGRVEPVHSYSNFPSVYYEEKLKPPPKEKQSNGNSNSSTNSSDKKTGSNEHQKSNRAELPEIFQLILRDNLKKYLPLGGEKGEFELTLIIKRQRLEKGISLRHPTAFRTQPSKERLEMLNFIYKNSDAVFKTFRGSAYTGQI